VNLQIRPTLLGLVREGAGPVLVALQVAVALAVLVNAVYVVKQRIDKIGRPSGIDVENIFAIRSLGFTERYLHEPTIRADLEYLRSLPDVEGVTVFDYLPFAGRGNRLRVMLKDGDMDHAVRVAVHEVDDQALGVLGVGIVAGRNFQPQEILGPKMGEAATTTVPQVLITKALAEDLFADGQAVGKGLYGTGGYLGYPSVITGVIENMHGHTVNWDKLDRVLLMPRLPYPDEPGVHYVVRVRPGRMAAVMETTEQWIRPLEFFRHRSYTADRNMAVFLVTVTVLLLIITSLGVFGLATFNVSTRTKQIGTRRAVGARRIDIVAQFIVENWLVTTAGVVLGCVLALVAGSWLSTEYELPRLDLFYLVGGIPILWLVGLLAAWYPARRAAAISPAVATRAV
jgi:putative ABC transport system permease protein